MRNLADNHSEFCYLKGAIRCIKEDGIIVWSPTDNRKAENAAREMQKFEQLLDGDQEAAQALSTWAHEPREKKETKGNPENPNIDLKRKR